MHNGLTTVKGKSFVTTREVITGRTWSVVAKTGCFPRFDRVDSASNPAYGWFRRRLHIILPSALFTSSLSPNEDLGYCAMAWQSDVYLRVGITDPIEGNASPCRLVLAEVPRVGTTLRRPTTTQTHTRHRHRRTHNTDTHPHTTHTTHDTHMHTHTQRTTHHTPHTKPHHNTPHRGLTVTVVSCPCCSC